MNLRIVGIERYLNLLFLFLFPTQLALHIWPSYAFIYGIRIDYLAPTLYLTDIIFIVLFIFWLYKNIAKLKIDIKKYKYFLVFIFLIAFLNIIFSASLEVSLMKWFKIFEYIFIAYYVSKRKEVFTKRNVSNILFFSLIFFSLIGIIQFVKGGTVSNLLYIFGERRFSIYTPGIALVHLFNRNLLRTYSTFPHPNSFAGFLGASIIFLFINRPMIKPLFKLTGFVIIVFTLLLTFSLSVFVSLIICTILYLLFDRLVFNNKFLYFLLIFVVTASLYFSVFSGMILNLNLNLRSNIMERLELANISGFILSRNWLFGTGLNTFIIKEGTFGNIVNGIWLLQPVHNVYLLIFAETGILGIALFIMLLKKIFSIIINKKVRWGMYILIFVMLSALFDHYWLTIQQNMLLLSLFTGILLREDKKYVVN